MDNETRIFKSKSNSWVDLRVYEIKTELSPSFSHNHCAVKIIIIMIKGKDFQVKRFSESREGRRV